MAAITDNQDTSSTQSDQRAITSKHQEYAKRFKHKIKRPGRVTRLEFRHDKLPLLNHFIIKSNNPRD